MNKQRYRTIPCLERILFLAVLREDISARCRTNRSIFVLVGNPGVIWNPTSSQCVHTMPNIERSHDGLILVDPDCNASHYAYEMFFHEMV